MVSQNFVFGFSVTVLLPLCVFCLTALLAAAVVLQILLRRPSWFRWLRPLCATSVPFIAAALAVDAINATSQMMSQTGHYLVGMVIVGFAIVISRVPLPRSLASGGSLAIVLSQLITLGVCLATACWSGHRFYSEVVVKEDLGFFDDVPGSLEFATDAMGKTDSGESVKLWRWKVDPDAFEYYAALSAQRVANLHEKIILQAPPDQRSNCHGWVFTGGHYLLRGGSVERILKDNGYRETKEPQVNDVVIYRGCDGVILHTALVRSVFDDGTVLLESKWGVDGRYLHRPENQPYSTVFSYYRSPRPGHQIVIRPSSQAVADRHDVNRKDS